MFEGDFYVYILWFELKKIYMNIDKYECDDTNFLKDTLDVLFL